jgi:hypothetical protein
MDSRTGGARQWLVRVALALAGAGICALGVVASDIAAADTGTVINPFAGNWDTDLGNGITGTVAFKVISAADGASQLQAMNGHPCGSPTTYYHGDYTDTATTGDQGTMTGCISGGNLVGRYADTVSNRGGGDFNFHIDTANTFSGYYTGDIDPSQQFPYKGTFVSHFPGDGCCATTTTSSSSSSTTTTSTTTTTTTHTTTGRPAPKKLRISFKHIGSFKGFVPHEAIVANGAHIMVCNDSHIFSIPFARGSMAAKSSSLVVVIGKDHNKEWRLPDAKNLLAPGRCGNFTVHNPTKQPIKLSLYDAIHSSAKLVLTIEPTSG